MDMQKLGKILILSQIFLQITIQDDHNSSFSSLKQDTGITNETGSSEFTNFDKSKQVVKDSLIAINNVFKDQLPKNNFTSIQQLQEPIFVNNLFEIDQLRQFSDIQQQKAATHILMFFTMSNLNNFSQLKKYLYKRECQSKQYGDLKTLLINTHEHPIADITYYQYHKGFELIQQWLSYKNQLFEYLQNTPTIDDYSQLEQVIDWQGYKEFNIEFTEYYQYFIDETRLINCGMANFLNFYNLVYRFVYTLQDIDYKNNPSTQQTFQQLYEESQVYYRQIYDSFLHRLYFMYYWATLMEQLHFLISLKDEQQNFFIQKMIQILLYFDQPIKYSFNKVDKIEVYCQSNHESTINLLSRIEQSLKSNDKKLHKEYATLDQIYLIQSGSFTKILGTIIVLIMILLN